MKSLLKLRTYVLYFVLSPTDTVLSSQESVQLLLRAIRCPHGEQTNFSDMKLSNSTTEPLEPCANRPYRDFLQRLPDWGLSSSADNITEAALTFHATLVLKWRVSPVYLCSLII